MVSNEEEEGDGTLGGETVSARDNTGSCESACGWCCCCFEVVDSGVEEAGVNTTDTGAGEGNKAGSVVTLSGSLETVVVAADGGVVSLPVTTGSAVRVTSSILTEPEVETGKVT